MSKRSDRKWLRRQTAAMIRLADAKLARELALNEQVLEKMRRDGVIPR